jgi:hypothetical protein
VRPELSTMILPYREFANVRVAGCTEAWGDGAVAVTPALGFGVAGADVADETHATKRKTRPASRCGRMIAEAYRPFISGLLRLSRAIDTSIKKANIHKRHH